jgi:uncharacterized protein
VIRPTKHKESLLEAAKRGALSSVRICLKRGANPNERDRTNTTPLHWAVQEGFLSVARCLLKYGADVNAVDDGGFTALAIAAGGGRRDLVAELMKAGAAPNRRGFSNGNGTALHLACSWNRYEVVARLVQHPSIRLNLRDSDGKTPLDYAQDAGRQDLITLLKRSGAKRGPKRAITRQRDSPARNTPAKARRSERRIASVL